MENPFGTDRGVQESKNLDFVISRAKLVQTPNDLIERVKKCFQYWKEERGLPSYIEEVPVFIAISPTPNLQESDIRPILTYGMIKKYKQDWDNDRALGKFYKSQKEEIEFTSKELSSKLGFNVIDARYSRKIIKDLGELFEWIVSGVLGMFYESYEENKEKILSYSPYKYSIFNKGKFYSIADVFDFMGWKEELYVSKYGKRHLDYKLTYYTEGIRSYHLGEIIPTNKDEFSSHIVCLLKTLDQLAENVEQRKKVYDIIYKFLENKHNLVMR